MNERGRSTSAQDCVVWGIDHEELVGIRSLTVSNEMGIARAASADVSGQRPSSGIRAPLMADASGEHR